MTDSVVVKITDRARAVLAFAEELEAVERQLQEERARHARKMDGLEAMKQALEQSIYRCGAN